MLGRKPPPPKPDLLPPMPVNPWRVPPMGSMGDAWDEVVELPPDPVAMSSRDDRRAPRRIRRRKLDDIIIRSWIPPLYLPVVFAWMAIGLSFASTGPLQVLMPLWAGLGFVLAATSIYMIKMVHRESQGMRLSIVACVVALLLILLDYYQPNVPMYYAYFKRTSTLPVRSLQFADKISYVENSMDTLATVTRCAMEVLGDKTIAVGRDSVHRRLDRQSKYFAISTLVYPDDLASIDADFIVYTPSNLPPDPFSDDSRATYGVFATPTHLIIYSMGPDGEWQINPRKPVSPYETDPISVLAQFNYDSSMGMSGTGDIIRIYPLQDPGITDDQFTYTAQYDQCVEAREKLEKYK